MRMNLIVLPEEQICSRPEQMPFRRVGLLGIHSPLISRALLSSKTTLIHSLFFKRTPENNLNQVFKDPLDKGRLIKPFKIKIENPEKIRLN